jgi:hypothetical protein
MAVKIRSETLTTCRVATDGSNVELEFLDHSGAPVVLELPLDQAEAVVMTLPHLLARAVRSRAGNDEARYVFGLHEWSIEAAKDNNCLITTLKTTNGFEPLAFRSRPASPWVGTCRTARKGPSTRAN